MPFVFFGVLVERDAEILIDLNCLGQLRYRGNLSPYIEYSYLLPGLEDQWQNTPRLCVEKELERLGYDSGRLIDKLVFEVNNLGMEYYQHN